jgi:colanic acid/amylovoran biosynthesis glycosyltransferase
VGREKGIDPEQPTLRIAFLVGQFPWLSATFILNQITGLIERGHEVTIFAEHGQGSELGLRAYRIEDLPQHPIQRLFRMSSVWAWDRAHLRALNVLRYGLQSASLRLLWGVQLFHGRRDFDIIQCHFGALGLKAVLLRRAGALRGAIVTAMHGEDILCYPRRFRGNIYQPLFADGDLFLPISDRWNPKLIEMGCPPAKIRRHRMGVDLDRFSRAGERQQQEGPIRILTVARLVESKGIEDAIRAVAGSPIPIEFVVVGDGPLRTRLQKAAEGLPVYFQGACRPQEVASIMKGADLFLLPCAATPDGDREGMPVAIMEAMASSLPVVSTTNSAIPELVADGVSGILVAEHDIDGLSHAITRLAEDTELRRRMGDAGRKIVEADYDIRLLNQQLEQHYGLLGRVSGRDVPNVQPPGPGAKSRFR